MTYTVTISQRVFFFFTIVPVAVVYTNDKHGIVKVNGMDG